jgi:1,2-diacylglycerol 3-alpha-glucosyltransferase
MFSHGYVPTVSGVTLVVQKIARAMVRRGHQVTVVTASESGKPYQAEDEGVHLVRTWGIPNPGWTEGPIPFIRPSAIRALADQFQPDVIHTHDNAALSNLLLRVKWKEPQVLISSCYSLPSYVTQYPPFRWFKSDVEVVVWKAMVGNLNNFDHVVFCTRTHEREFLAHGLRSPTTVISNGINLQRYNPQKETDEDVERRYALPPAPRILSVGRLMKDKKLDLLIQAMSQVCCTGREAHLLVVGRGDDRPHLKALICQLKLEPFIHLLGFVPEQDMPALYRACDLFAIPSLVEVQSLPTLQAAVTGLPIVAADSAALPELVRNGENGFLVEPLNARALGDAILYILDHPDEARRMGQVSLTIGREHDEQITFQAYEDFYQRMAK